MFWLMVAIVAVVVFGTVAVAAGAGGTLAQPAGDPQPLAGLDRPVEPADVAAVRFPVVLRGYRMDAVDETLQRLGAELAERDARISHLEIALGVRPEPGPEPPAGEPWPPDTDLEPPDPEPPAGEPWPPDTDLEPPDPEP